MSCTLNTNFETGPNLLQCMSLLVALFDVCRDAPILPQLEHKRTLRGHHECVAIDPKRSLCGRIVLTETAAVCFYKSPLGKVT